MYTKCTPRDLKSTQNFDIFSEFQTMCTEHKISRTISLIYIRTDYLHHLLFVN